MHFRSCDDSCGCRTCQTHRSSCAASCPSSVFTAAPPLPPSCLSQFLVPRQSYLHSVVPQALQALQHLLPPGEQSPWFEHGQLPLRWGVPAGVLYDLVAAPGGELPWRLTIHFRQFPSRYVCEGARGVGRMHGAPLSHLLACRSAHTPPIRLLTPRSLSFRPCSRVHPPACLLASSMLPAYGGEAALQAAYVNSLKEAACCAAGSAHRVMQMAAGAQVRARERLSCALMCTSRTHLCGRLGLLRGCSHLVFPPSTCPLSPAQSELWRQVLAGNLASYRRILAPLQLTPAPRGGGRRPMLPLRLYIRRDTGGACMPACMC